MDADEEELRAIGEQIALATTKALREAVVVPRANHIKRLIKAVAERRKVAPGLSGWRNSYLAHFADQKGGVQQLQFWTQMWTKHQIGDRTAALWTQQIIAPKDCGQHPEHPDDPQKRKLRPIALEEAPVKFSESAAIDALGTDTYKTIEPWQVGSGTPDGAILAIQVLQAWARQAADEHMGCRDDGRQQELNELVKN